MKRDTLIYMLADLFGRSIAFVTYLLLTRLLTQEQYGSLSTLMAIWSAIEMVKFAGMDFAFPFFVTQKRGAQSLEHVVITSTVVGTIVLVFTVLVFSYVSYIGNWLAIYAEVTPLEVAAFLVTLIPFGLLRWFLHVLRYLRRPMSFVWVNAVGNIANGVLSVIVIYFLVQEARLIGYFVVSLVFYSAASFIGIFELNRNGLNLRLSQNFSAPLMKNMLSYGLVLVPAAVAYSLSSVVDRLLVSYFNSVEEVAIVSLAIVLGAIPLMFKQWFALAWDPQVVEWIANRTAEEYIPLIQRMLSLVATFMLGVACLVNIWSLPLVQLLFPAAYSSVARLLPILALAGVFSTLSLFGVVTTLVSRRPRHQLIVYLIGLGINVVAGLLLIPQLGALGAVIGTLFSEVAILLVWVYLGKHRSKNLPLNWGWAFSGLAVVSGFILLYPPEYQISGTYWVERAIVSVVVIAIFSYLLLRQNVLSISLPFRRP